MQAVYKELSLPVEELDWRDASPAEQEQRLTALPGRGAGKGLRPIQAPLMHLALITRTSESRAAPLIWSHHHILMDGWSMPVLLKEVFTLYEAVCGPRRRPCCRAP